MIKDYGNMFHRIGGKSFKTVQPTCDICGWGDTLIFENVIVDQRRYDFCKRHTENEIVTYIEMGLPTYSVKTGKPITDKNLKNKQIPMGLE